MTFNIRLLFGITICVFSCLAVTGCGEKSIQATPARESDHFEVKLDVVSDDAELYIAKINLLFSGRHSVKVLESDHGQSKIHSAVSPNGEASVLVVFSYSDVGRLETAKTLFSSNAVSEGEMSTMKVPAGGPSEFVVREDEEPKDVFSFTATPGDHYPFGQPITIAKIPGEPVKLVVN